MTAVVQVYLDRGQADELDPALLARLLTTGKAEINE